MIEPHELPENPTPQDYGLPEKPSLSELQRWDRQEAYLEAFAESGSVGEAARVTGIPVATVESWDLRDMHGFKKRLTAAKLLALGIYEREIKRRGVDGIPKGIYHQGELKGTELQYSDNLLMFRTKKLDPSYRDNPQAVAPAANKVTIVYNYAPGVVPVPPPEQPQVTEGEYRELPDGGERAKQPSAETVTETGSWPLSVDGLT